MALASVFTYLDFRQYLRDYYEHEKATGRYFSYRYFAQRAGLKAPVLLKMVMDGQRNISRGTIEKFIRGLRLKDKEAVYFRNLVLFNQARTALEKQEHYRVLHAMARQVQQHLVEDDDFEYYDKWYYSAIREGVCQREFGDDWRAIGASLQPPISPEQARQAVGWLLQRGFIRRIRPGVYEQTHRAITTRSEIASLAVRNFNRTMIQLAERSLDAVPSSRRHATGLTIGLSAEAYHMVVAEIEALRDRVVSMVDALQSSDRVYQLNVQLFPLMERESGKQGGA